MINMSAIQNQIGRQMMAMNEVKAYLEVSNGGAEESKVLAILDNYGLEAPTKNTIEEIIEKYSSRKRTSSTVENLVQKYSPKSQLNTQKANQVKTKTKKNNPAVQTLLSFGEGLEQRKQRIEQQQVEDERENERIQARRNAH